MPVKVKVKNVYSKKFEQKIECALDSIGKNKFFFLNRKLEVKVKKNLKEEVVSVKEVDNDDDARMLAVYLTYTPQANTIQLNQEFSKIN